MSLKNKIQQIIDVINNSNIEEIEVSSFWGAQKIKLSKSKLKQQDSVIIKEPIIKMDVVKDSVENSNVSKNDSILEADTENQQEAAASDTVMTVDVEEKSEVVMEDLEYQKAPLVGTFYLSSKPGEPSFVSIGDTVSKGQTICIIEAMKIFNEIESDFDGEIVEILVDDESPVEFNQEIFSIRPN